MEAVIFVGLPGSGKSSFYKERFFHTHVRISMDLLKTRHRERRIMEVCLATDQRFVIDNTNPTKTERSVYIQAAKPKRYTITGYYFAAKVEGCLLRNAQRADAQRVPDVAILSAAKRLEIPSLAEGFDKLFYVRLEPEGFVVEEWNDEI
jgi:predicted kinase